MSQSSTPVTPAAPDDLDRRGWMRAAIGVLVGGIAAVVGVVTGGAVLSPSFARPQENWVPAGRLPDLAAGVPTPVTVRIAREDGYYEAVDAQVVFLIKAESGAVRALSSTCTHLGCHVNYDAAAKLFKCPCHGGVYNADGKVVAGPPPRPLTELPARVDGAQVFVQV